MRLFALTYLLAALACPLGSLAAVVNFRALTKAPTPPSQDPFYKPPAGFQKKSPGAILRHRPVPHPLLVGPALDVGSYQAAFQILYRTTDGLGNAQATVSTLVIPKNADFSKLLVYSTFEDSPDEDCAPSYTLQKGQNNTNIEGVIMSSVLRQGWILQVADYEGPIAAFTVGKQAGHATLDAIRATLNSASFSKVHKDAKIVMFGYSGGALASEWASELQPSYAPDLKIAGAAFGGLTPNVTAVILSVNDTPNSDLIPKGVLGFANQYKSVQKFLKKSLKPAKAAAFDEPRTSCSSSSLSKKNIFNYFKQGSAIFDDPILNRTVMQNGIMGLTNTPKIPIYLFKSTGDEVSPVADTDALVQKYCNAGASIHYVRNHFGDHESEFIVGLPHALHWAKARLSGKAAPKGCKTHNENVSKLHRSAIKILGKTVWEELKEELGTFTR